MRFKEKKGMGLENSISEIEVRRYSKAKKREWDAFCKTAKNQVFLFYRDYMDYHSDRFADHSLIFLKGNTIVALLPANEKDGILCSHGGLTYGGIILDSHAKQHIVNSCFISLIAYAREHKIRKIIYKTVPYIYHRQPAEEDRYALYRCGAKLAEVCAATVVNLKNPLNMSKGRKAQISRAKREGVKVRRVDGKPFFDDFMRLENEVLQSRHQTRAVHSADELYMLSRRFPGQIHLYGAFLEQRLIAGTVVYEYGPAVHTQYMAADDTARKIGALDLAVASVITDYKESKLWLDFGISTEYGGNYLNEGLISQKEGFGGRTVIYETWVYTGD